MITPVKHYLLWYDVAEDYLTRREPYRATHLGLARAAHERGELVLAGALDEPADGAVLIFRTAAAAEAFAKSDPYVENGVVRRWRVRTWNVVVGA